MFFVFVFVFFSERAARYSFRSSNRRPLSSFVRNGRGRTKVLVFGGAGAFFFRWILPFELSVRAVDTNLIESSADLIPVSRKERRAEKEISFPSFFIASSFFCLTTFPDFFARALLSKRKK